MFVASCRFDSLHSYVPGMSSELVLFVFQGNLIVNGATVMAIYN